MSDPLDGSGLPAEPAPAPGAASDDADPAPSLGEAAVNSVVGVLGTMRDQVVRLQRLVGPELKGTEDWLKPIWQRTTEAEHRLPVAVAIAVAIALQINLPSDLAFHPHWLLPTLEGALLVGLVAANPKRIDRSSRLLRTVSLTLIAVISVANAWSAGALIRGLIDGTQHSEAGTLLGSGAAIYLTNVIVFGLWYWELDRGGAAARAQALRPYPDFLFPQMENESLAPPGWKPTIVDYFYLSFTNATAFSPTDVLPLSRVAKALMLVQSGVSLTTAALVVARAVNILK